MIRTRIEGRYLEYRLKFFALNEYFVSKDPRELKKDLKCLKFSL